MFLREEVGRADFTRDVQGALVACAADAKCAVKVAEDFEVAIGGVEVVGLNVAADGEVERGVVQQRALQGEVAVDDDVVAVGGGVQFGGLLLQPGAVEVAVQGEIAVVDENGSAIWLPGRSP